MVWMGFELRAAQWKVQTKPPSYLWWPPYEGLFRKVNFSAIVRDEANATVKQWPIL